MDYYIEQINEHSVQVVKTGVILALYLMFYLSFHAILKGQMENLKFDVKFENPYDLFTYVYPSLRDMDNERIDELVTLIDNYNKKWINISD